MAKKQKKIRKNVTRGIAYVKASFNNTQVAITDTGGEMLCWGSAGTVGFKGSRKSTPFAATRAAAVVAGKAIKMGMQEIEVRVRGAGSGRESAITALQRAGLRITAVEDHTPIPHKRLSSQEKKACLSVLWFLSAIDCVRRMHSLNEDLVVVYSGFRYSSGD